MSHETKKPTCLKKYYFLWNLVVVVIIYIIFIVYLGTTDLDATGRRVSLQQKQQQQQQQ